MVAHQQVLAAAVEGAERRAGAVAQLHGGVGRVQAAVLHRRQGDPQEVRLPRVVGVQERDVAAPGRGDARVAGPTDAGVLAGDDADPCVEGRQPLQHPGCVVGRAVVDDDELPAAVRLRLHRHDRAPQCRSPVPRRHDDAHERVLEVGCGQRDGVDLVLQPLLLLLGQGVDPTRRPAKRVLLLPGAHRALSHRAQLAVGDLAVRRARRDGQRGVSGGRGDEVPERPAAVPSGLRVGTQVLRGVEQRVRPALAGAPTQVDREGVERTRVPAVAVEPLRLEQRGRRQPAAATVSDVVDDGAEVGRERATPLQLVPGPVERAGRRDGRDREGLPGVGQRLARAGCGAGSGRDEPADDAAQLHEAYPSSRRAGKLSRAGPTSSPSRPG